MGGLLVPRAVASTFGASEPSNEYLALLCSFSIRNLALAAAFQLVAGDDQMRKRFFTVAATMFPADTVAGLLSAATGRASWRTVGTLGILTGGLAAIAASGAKAD